jgi:hypothetical protein
MTMTVDELFSQPLIWTSKGNLPLSALTYETVWEDHPDHVKFVERHRLDGEVVKESCHVYNRAGLVLGAESAT